MLKFLPFAVAFQFSARSKIFEINSKLANLTDLYGGDMRINDDDFLQLRAPVCSTCRRWLQQGNHYPVPYRIDGFTEVQRDRMRWAMDYVESETNIKFIPRTTETDFVRIIGQGGCTSWLGRIGGMQDLTLGPGCVFIGIIIHELFHALGLGHEHQRHEQGEKLIVHWNNIDPNFISQFTIRDNLAGSDIFTPYDFASLMHYRGTSFALSGRRAFDSRVPQYTRVMDGDRVEMSSCDISAINQLYPGNKASPRCIPHEPPNLMELTDFAKANTNIAQSEETCLFNNEVFFVGNGGRLCQLRPITTTTTTTKRTITSELGEQKYANTVVFYGAAAGALVFVVAGVLGGIQYMRSPPVHDFSFEFE